MIRPVPVDALPPYLRAVTLLEPEGNIVAEILEAVGALSGWRRYARQALQAVMGSVVVGSVVTIAVLWQEVQQGDCEVTAASVCVDRHQSGFDR